MTYHYETQGTCSTQIHFELEGNIVHNVRFTNGCDGNLQAIGRLVEGMTVQAVEQRCRGIRCGHKSTSCADQLAQALRKALDGSANKAG